MLSRRLVRIKVLQILYSRFLSDEHSLKISEKELFLSLNKSYELYNYILLLLTDIVHYAEIRIDIGRQKNIPTSDEVNHNLKFVSNFIIRSISDSNQFQKYIFENKISWDNYPELIKKLYKNIINSDGFKRYMRNPELTIDNDRKLVKYILRKVFAGSEDLVQVLEEKSIYWNDELEFIISNIINMISEVSEEQQSITMPEPYNDNNEDNFARRLLHKSVINLPEYRSMLEHNIKNWDIERITIIDVLIMALAITELIEFPFIPVKVTLNEYIEIARYYSTAKSGQFINGLLDKLVLKLKSEGRIQKKGKGLKGEI
jgi:N utilization substance protein B